MNWEQNNQVIRPANVAAGKTLRQVVMSTLNRVGNYNTSEYRRLMQIAIECVTEEIRLYHASTVEVFYTKVGDSGIIEMPKDCLKYIKIGVNMGGFLYILGVNEDIILNRATRCAVPVDDITRGGLAVFAPNDGYYFSEHINGLGQSVGGMYGLGGGFTNPQYRWDDTAKRFQLAGTALIGREVIIEYQSTGVGPGTIIEQELISPIRTYLTWQRIENDPRTSANEKDRKMDQYYRAIELLRTYKNMFTLQEFLDTKYKNSSQSVKR
jgi:hypothetical protein